MSFGGHGDTPPPAPKPPRVVLDTEPVLSALVLSGGATADLRKGWQSRRFTPLASKATAGELMRVLTSPRFALPAGEQEELLFDYLLFCEIVDVPVPPPPTATGRDPFDVPFLELAVAGRASCLVTGSRDLPGLAAGFPCPIVEAGEFLAQLEPG